MERINFIILFSYITLFIQYASVYSFNQSKGKGNNVDVLGTTTRSPKANEEERYFKARESMDEITNARKERNGFKIRKNVNKLYSTLYPNEMEMEEEIRENQGYNEHVKNNMGKYSKHEIQDKNKDYDILKSSTYGTAGRNGNEVVRHNRGRVHFPNGNIMNKELSGSYLVSPGEFLHNNSIIVEGSNNEDETTIANNSINAEGTSNGETRIITSSWGGGGGGGNNDKYITDKKNALHILGSSEKMKSESKFAMVDYLKDFFQNSEYMKKFQRFIEIFFNKYDQRVLESTIFFNFDETLF
ncbi:hypothetical protein, conserved [Plasmodium gonderi]|uniref:Uncharacterized protein n=1 Tax=Plasmodium gonderi TaxID=77519 RepID=A0A1Y1JDQ9_PLAGO|nr:hypothetical protein, conserved [Plasmodium gonderi]GAW80669.1 hypothetical protein, conserved [Plasmodium gonderi]